MKKRVNFFALSGLLTGVMFTSACAEPAMPIGFEATATNAENTAWREFGFLPMSYAMAVVAVKAAMEAQGYAEKHDIVSGGGEGRRVMLWEKENEKIILMLWEIDIDKTGCAWGVSDG